MRRHGLRPHRYEQVASWPFGDFVFGALLTDLQRLVSNRMKRDVTVYINYNTFPPEQRATLRDAKVNLNTLMDATGGTDGIKKFITDYKAEYGNDPENAFAALGYDTVYLMADAIKRAGGTDSAAVKTALEATKDFKGITGSITLM